MNRELTPAKGGDDDEAVVDLMELPLWPATAGEWHPWLARKLGLGSLPHDLGLLVVVSSVLPVLVATFVLSMDLDAYMYGLGLLEEHGRRLGSKDTCTTNTIVAYIVSAICFACIVAAFGKGLSANPALVTIIKKNAEAEKDLYLETIKGVATTAHDSIRDGVTGGVTNALHAGQDQMANNLKEGLLEGDTQADDYAQTVAGGISNTANAIGSALEGVPADAVGDVKSFLEGQLKKSKLYGIVNVVRFCIAETAILIGLLAPSFGCGAVQIWAYIQAFFGGVGSALTLAILAWCALQMARDPSGMYKYFPGSQSNNIYQLVTGVTPRAILPDRGAVTGTMRINWTTKYIMMACGVSMGMGLFIQFLAAIFMTFQFSFACNGNNCDSPVQVWMSWGMAVAVKIPEITMYQMLFYTMVADFYAFMLGIVPCCCIFRRGYDDDDKKELCTCGGWLSCFSTRQNPPEIKGWCCSNSCGVRLEKMFFSFYQWFYMFIDKPLSGVRSFVICYHRVFSPKCYVPPPCGIDWDKVRVEYRE